MSTPAERVTERLEGLKPKTRIKCLLFLAVAADQGIPCRITETFRSVLVQRAYYAQGREDPNEVNRLRVAAGLAPLGRFERNRVITNALPGTSNHGKGIAFDIAPMRWDHKLIPDWASPYWSRLGEIAKEVGLAWGGNWTRPDRPHFEDLENAD